MELWGRDDNSVVDGSWTQKKNFKLLTINSQVFFNVPIHRLSSWWVTEKPLEINVSHCLETTKSRQRSNICAASETAKNRRRDKTAPKTSWKSSTAASPSNKLSSILTRGKISQAPGVFGLGRNQQPFFSADRADFEDEKSAASTSTFCAKSKAKSTRLSTSRDDLEIIFIIIITRHTTAD